MERWGSCYRRAFSMPVSTRLIRKMENESDRVHDVAGEKIYFKLRKTFISRRPRREMH